jgi:CheY-like chemotaxis protein
MDRLGDTMRTLLLLEDDPTLLKFLRHTLRDYRLIEATSAEEALLLFIDHEYQVDLLVAKLTLPTKSGAQVAFHMRSKIPDLPVILTSTAAISNWSERDYSYLRRLEEMPVAVLQKPYAGHKLLALISELTGWPAARKANVA